MPLLTACAATPSASRPLGEAGAAALLDDDVVALLPSGAEVVADLDVAQLRAWPSAKRLRAALPPEARARIEAGLDLLADVDAAAIGIAGAGGDAAEVTLIARGRFDRERLRAALTAQAGGATEIDYHGRTMIVAAASAFTFLTPRTVAFGSTVAVRRAIDVALGNDEGVRRDRTIAELFARLPSAKKGRPAALLAARMTPALGAKLAASGIAVDGVRWIGAAIAVGDGIDIGGVAGAPNPEGAVELAARLRRGLDGLSLRPSLRALGLSSFIELVKTAQRRDEVHLAFRVAERRLVFLLDRLERLVQAADDRTLSGAAR